MSSAQLHHLYSRMLRRPYPMLQGNSFNIMTISVSKGCFRIYVMLMDDEFLVNWYETIVISIFLIEFATDVNVLNFSLISDTPTELYNISYLWYSSLAVIVGVSVALIVSVITGKECLEFMCFYVFVHKNAVFYQSKQKVWHFTSGIKWKKKQN